MTQTASELLEAAQLARRQHRLDDAHRELVEAVRLCRQSGERRQISIRALKALGQIPRTWVVGRLRGLCTKKPSRPAAKTATL